MASGAVWIGHAIWLDIGEVKTCLGGTVFLLFVEGVRSGICI